MSKTEGKTSDRKLQANRQNARRSTGPRTAEGKARSRMNATRHGILASDAVIRAGEGREDEGRFEDVLNDLRTHFAPTGPMEELLVEKLAVTVWRQRRALRYEVGAIRDRSDEATQTWRLEESRSRGMYMESTEFLKGHARMYRELLKIVARPDPLKDASSDFVHALCSEASHLNVNVNAILGLPDKDDWEELDFASVDREAVEQVVDGICSRVKWNPQDFWQEIGENWLRRYENAAHLLAVRLEQEDRVRMLASLPEDTHLNRVLRYEGHLSREFARTLEQLYRVRAAVDGGEAQK